MNRSLIIALALLAAPASAAEAAEAAEIAAPGIMPLEFNADAFQHMERYFPMATVAKGAVASPLPRGEALTHATGKFGAVDLEAFNVDNGSTGMLVVHRDVVRYERYWQGANEASHFTSWSMAKSVTSTLGVKFDETYESPTSDVGRFMALGVRAGNANGFLTTLIEKAAPPGTKFNYNTAETQVLGWVVHNATGKAPAAYLSEKLWQPLGMEDDATWFVDRAGGMEATGMGLNARLRDYARFGLLMLHDGVHDGQRLLPEGWVARATRPGAPHLMPGKLYADGSYPLGYQYQWWVQPNGAFEAEGVFGQFLYVDPAHDLVVAKTSAWPEAWVNERETAFYDVIDALIQTLEAGDG